MQKQTGITLIELLVTVAIVAILSSIAVPSYNRYIVDSRHSEAKSALLELGQFMERYYSSNGLYTKVSGASSASLTTSDLPFSSVPRDGGTTYYNVSVISSSATYTVTLSPTGVMAGDSCGNYTLNQTGSHSPATSSDCW